MPSISVVAHHGGGPGEVVSPIGVALLGDSVLAVRNAGRRRIEFFDANSLRFRNGELVNWPSTSMSAWGGTLVFGALNLDSMTSVAILNAPSKAPLRGGVVPAIYRRHPMLADAFAVVEIAKDDSTVTEVFEVSNTVYRWHIASNRMDSVVLSVKDRPTCRLSTGVVA